MILAGPLAGHAPMTESKDNLWVRPGPHMQAPSKQAYPGLVFPAEISRWKWPAVLKRIFRTTLARLAPGS